MDGFFSGLPMVDVHQPLLRNIKSIVVSQDLFDDLSDDPRDWDVAQRHEMNTKPPTYESANTIIDRPFEEADWFAAIGFPFREWTESRYSDGTFGIWYGADTLETSIHETVYHWRRMLADSELDKDISEGRRPPISGDRKVYNVRCDAVLPDLRVRTTDYPALIADDYGFTQQIGSRLHHERHPGMAAKSARYDGDCYAILNPGVLSKPQAICYLSYRMTANGIIEIERGQGDVILRL